MTGTTTDTSSSPPAVVAGSARHAGGMAGLARRGLGSLSWAAAVGAVATFGLTVVVTRGVDRSRPARSSPPPRCSSCWRTSARSGRRPGWSTSSPDRGSTTATPGPRSGSGSRCRRSWRCRWSSRWRSCSRPTRSSQLVDGGAAAAERDQARRLPPPARGRAAAGRALRDAGRRDVAASTRSAPPR